MLVWSAYFPRDPEVKENWHASYSEKTLNQFI